MGKIDVKKLKARLTHKDHESIMEALGIPLFVKNKDNLIYWTGDKHRNPYDGSPKLIYYLDTNIYISYTANRSYDIISLTQQRLNILGQPATFMDAVKFIMGIVGLEDEQVTRVHSSKYVYDWQKDLEKYVRFRKNGTLLPIYDSAILDQLSETYPVEWINEGISVETMAKYHIGHYQRANATTIPCFTREGELCGIRVRNWQPDQLEDGRKYVPLTLLNGTSYKFPTGQVFYGINYNSPEIERTGTVILVESEKAVMKLDSFYGEKNVALAMFGKNLGIQRRNELIKLGVKKVIYVPDHDYIGKGDQAFDEWEMEVKQFAKQFNGYAQVEVVWDAGAGLMGAKDNATDKDKETWEKLFDIREVVE